MKTYGGRTVGARHPPCRRDYQDESPAIPRESRAAVSTNATLRCEISHHFRARVSLGICPACRGTGHLVRRAEEPFRVHTASSSEGTTFGNNYAGPPLAAVLSQSAQDSAAGYEANDSLHCFRPPRPGVWDFARH